MGHPGLDDAAGAAEGREGAGGAAHEDAEQPVVEAFETFRVGDELVDPHGDLEPERHGDGVLGVRASGHGQRGGRLGELGGGPQDAGELVQQGAVGVAQHEDVRGLRDVLGRGAPVHPSAVLGADGARELLDEGTRGWLASAVAARTRLMSSFSMRAVSAMARADSLGMSPASASARASAASTSSRACHRFSRVKSLATPGSGTRPSVNRPNGATIMAASPW